MVTTGGTSAGGSGFEYGENTVAARLSIDIPNEGVQSLREITQEISRFRTEMEAASRSQGDFMGFFQTLPSIANQAATAYKTFADELERGLALQQRMQGAIGQWDVQPGSTPDNFRGMTSGMGRSGPEDINQTIADMDRMREMGTVGQRQYLNVQQQRGALQASDMPMSNTANDIAAATERISAREMINQERIGSGITDGVGGRMGGQGGIAREIMNEFGAGGSQGGVLTQMLRRGIGAMTGGGGNRGGGGNSGNPHSSGAVPTPDSGSSGAVGADGEGVGAVGSSLGIAGGIGKFLGIGGGMAGLASLAGLGLTGYSAAQYLGPRIQNLREQGLVAGGGVQEGLEQEIQARVMAMNPFITNDQARSVLQSALRDGYKGKEYETVTKFMADNLKEFAISVQDSRDMLKKQMVDGGLTPEAMAAGLKQQEFLSKKGYLSFPDRVQAQNQLFGQLTDMGVSGDTAASTSAGMLEMFSDSQRLKGVVAEMAAGQQSDMGSQATALSLMGIQASTDTAEWGEQLAATGTQGMEQMLKKIARMATTNGRPNIGQFQRLLQVYTKKSLSVPAARELYQKIMGGKSEAAAADFRIENSGVSDVQNRNAGDTINSSVGSFFSLVGGSIADTVTGNYENIPGRFREASFESKDNHIPILDEIVSRAGGDPNRISVQDASGQWRKLQPGNKEQLESLAKGGKWRRSDDTESQGYTLREAPMVMNSAFGKQEVQVGGEVSIHVSTDPGVKVSGAPRTVTLTQNQIQSNAGWRTATMNNAPPGDR